MATKDLLIALIVLALFMAAATVYFMSQAMRAAGLEMTNRVLRDDAAAWRERAERATAEVQRLTDVIIRLKGEGKALHPMHEDTPWGAYVIDNALELEEERRRGQELPLPGPTAAQRAREDDDYALRRMFADF